MAVSVNSFRVEEAVDFVRWFSKSTQWSVFHESHSLTQSTASAEEVQMSPDVAIRFALLERRLEFMERRLDYYEAQLDRLELPEADIEVEAALKRLTDVEQRAQQLEIDAPPDEPDPPGIRLLRWSPLQCRGGDPVRLHLQSSGLSEQRKVELIITEVGRNRPIEEREVTLGELRHRSLVWNPPVLGARMRAYVFTVKVAGLEAQSSALLVRG